MNQGVVPIPCFSGWKSTFIGLFLFSKKDFFSSQNNRGLVVIFNLFEFIVAKSNFEDLRLRLEYQKLYLYLKIWPRF